MNTRKITGTLPDAVRVGLSRLGADLSAARRARRISQADMAERVGVGRNTIMRMEAGDHRVSIGVITAAAWVLGMENKLADAFTPEVDAGFVREARMALPRRIRSAAPTDHALDLDF